jgi:hypothetical protein
MGKCRNKKLGGMGKGELGKGKLEIGQDGIRAR